MQSTDKSSDDVLLSWYPRVVVIGPGGARGFKALGFLCSMEDSGLLNHVDTYCGVSVGAIIALLIVCGYDIRDIIGEAAKIDVFRELINFDINSSIENKGFVSSEPVRQMLTKLVLNKFGNVPTLHGLYMMTGKALVTGTLNATDEVSVMHGPFSHPNKSCIDATMFSMNIPFFFYQLIHEGKTYVDGALANPYPIDYFDDGNTNILGLYMKTTYENPKQNIKPNAIITPIIKQEELPIGAYYLKVIHSLMDHRRNDIIFKASNKCKNVCLETPMMDTIGYTVTSSVKATMLLDGWNQGKRFLEELSSNTNNTQTIPKEKYSYPKYYIGRVQ